MRSYIRIVRWTERWTRLGTEFILNVFVGRFHVVSASLDEGHVEMKLRVRTYSALKGEEELDDVSVVDRWMAA